MLYTFSGCAFDFFTCARNNSVPIIWKATKRESKRKHWLDAAYILKRSSRGYGLLDIWTTEYCSLPYVSVIVGESGNSMMNEFNMTYHDVVNSELYV